MEVDVEKLKAVWMDTSFEPDNEYSQISTESIPVEIDIEKLEYNKDNYLKSKYIIMYSEDIYIKYKGTRLQVPINSVRFLNEIENGLYHMIITDPFLSKENRGQILKCLSDNCIEVGFSLNEHTFEIPHLKELYKAEANLEVIDMSKVFLWFNICGRSYE